MKKICILSAVNIKHMSLIHLYTEIFKAYHIKYDIIYMDKYGEDEYIDAENKYVYRNIINQNSPRLLKALKYFKFRKYAIQTIEANKYDFIVVWNDIAIFMFADYLVRNFKNRYCLNIRDYCYQHNRFVFNRFKSVIESSKFSTISSEGYKDFLPKYNYCLIHSLNPILFSTLEKRTSFRHKGEPIRIGFIGYIRFFERNKRLLDLFKNDNRFELHYYGAKANILREYALDNNIENAFFHDSFPVEDTAKYLSKVDVINNLYGNESISLTKALSIKLYHAIYTRIPILVCPNTYMETVTKEYNIGFVFDDFTEEKKDCLYNWYFGLNFIEFKETCDNFITLVQTQNRHFEECVKSIIS